MMSTETLNKLSPEAREEIIRIEARLSELKLNRTEIDLQLNKLDNEESLI